MEVCTQQCRTTENPVDASKVHQLQNIADVGIRCLRWKYVQTCEMAAGADLRVIEEPTVVLGGVLF